MTIADARAQARRYARIDGGWSTGSGVADDDHVDDLIQDAVNQFARDVGGFSLEVYPEISAAFDTRDYFAIHVEIVENGSQTVDTDVVITGTDRSGATGSQVATDLQAAIRAMTGATGTETVAWSNFYFTIDWKQGNTASGDYIKVSAPTTTTYADATELLGYSGTFTGATSHDGTFPEGCTVEYSLPSDWITMQRVEWDGYEVWELPREYAMHQEASGDPEFYHIRGRTMHFIPSPATQGLCKVWYRGFPTAIDFDTDTDLPTEIPSNYHQAIPWLVASYLILEQFDDDKANRRRAEYEKIMRQYRLSRLSNNTSIDLNSGDRYLNYKVTM